MDLFSKAKVVRLRSHHDKYLVADDEECVIHDRNGASRKARWTVEFVDGDSRFVRLKSCYGRYLTASNKPFLLGLAGHKVVQGLPGRLDSSVEWEPVREGLKVKLKTRYGNFLRGNGGTYPYKNSVTHDVPSRTATRDWVLWDVDVIEILASTAPEPVPASPPTQSSTSARKPQQNINPPSSPPRRTRTSSTWGSDEVPPASPPRRTRTSSAWGSDEVPPASPPRRTRTSSAWGSDEVPPASPPRRTRTSSTWVSDEALPAKPLNGRMIHYRIADEEGNVDEGYESFRIPFEGSSVQELAQRLEEEMRMDGVVVCARNVLTDQLSPLRLRLPPNNAKMDVVIVPSSSKVAERFKEQGLI